MNVRRNKCKQIIPKMHKHKTKILQQLTQKQLETEYILVIQQLQGVKKH